MQYLRNDIVGSAIDDISAMRTAFEQRLLQSNDTFAVLLNITRSGMLTRAEEMRVVRGLIQSMQAAGAGQPSNRLARLNDIERRLADLNNRFMDNLQISQEVRYFAAGDLQFGMAVAAAAAAAAIAAAAAADNPGGGSISNDSQQTFAIR
jgi:Zn-dependent oligopeptidase